MLFASFARAHERIHLQNLRDFPQTKLDSEINVWGKFYANLVATIQALFLASGFALRTHRPSRGD